jgi:hypothetical protein
MKMASCMFSILENQHLGVNQLKRGVVSLGEN